MAYVTRKGTTVYNDRAINAIIYTHEFHGNNGSAEYRCYDRVTVKDGSIFAEAGDPLYVKPDEDDDERAYATNLTTGDSRTLRWIDLANSVKPAEDKTCDAVFADPQRNGCKCTLIYGHMGNHRGVVFADARATDAPVKVSAVSEEATS